MARILVTDGIEKKASESLNQKGFEVVEKFYELEDLKEAVKEFDAIVVRSATKVRQDVLDKALETKKLKAIIRGGVGIDNIDAKYAESNGIKVRNTPAASSASVAELTIAHMFSVARHVHISNHTMRLGQWNKKKYKGIELNGKTLGLIGFGRIAREVAVRAKALGMNVVYTDALGKFDDTDFRYVSLDEILKESDFVSLHIPGAADKKPVIGKDEIAMMKDGAFIINAARGGVVCEKSLLEALDNGKLAGAGLDVFEEEPTKNEKLYMHEKVSLTPHIGASTKEAQERIGDEIVEIIDEIFA